MWMTRLIGMQTIVWRACMRGEGIVTCECDTCVVALEPQVKCEWRIDMRMSDRHVNECIETLLQRRDNTDVSMWRVSRECLVHVWMTHRHVTEFIQRLESRREDSNVSWPSCDMSMSHACLGRSIRQSIIQHPYSDVESWVISHMNESRIGMSHITYEYVTHIYESCVMRHVT